MTSTQVFCCATTRSLFAATLAVSVSFGAEASATEPYPLFEGGQVRPLALSPNGKLLFAVATPRALAVTPDGSRVYAAAFHSGDRTTVVTFTAMNQLVTAPRVHLLMDRADEGECDLVAKGRVALAELGFFTSAAGNWRATGRPFPPFLMRSSA